MVNTKWMKYLGGIRPRPGKFCKDRTKLMKTKPFKVDILFGNRPAHEALNNFHGHSPAKYYLVGT